MKVQCWFEDHTAPCAECGEEPCAVVEEVTGCLKEYFAGLQLRGIKEAEMWSVAEDGYPVQCFAGLKNGLVWFKKSVDGGQK